VSADGMGSREQHRGPAGDRPPLCSLAADPTPITLGEIESLDRDLGIATLDPGMRFPGN